MKHSFSALACCALLGLAVAGCQDSQVSPADAPSPPTTAASTAGQAALAAHSAAPVSTAPVSTAAAPRTATAGPPSTQTGAASPASTAVRAATGTSAAPPLAGVGVVAACDAAPAHPLSREPSVIILACADAGLGVQDLTWTRWSASSATGHGVLWENECVPTASCGASKFSRYPVAVTLSVVKASAAGPWFSQLTVTWQDGRPPNQTPDTFVLEGPAH